jgi:hypothetical protein
MDVSEALSKLKKLVEEEKKQLDNIIRGAQLLAEMLTEQNQSGNRGKEQVEYSEPGLETAPGTGERYSI